VQVQAHAPALAALGFDLVAVGFSPPAALGRLALHLGWRHPFASDEDRTVYRRLEIGRAGARQLFNPGTLGIYRRALTAGHRIHRPVEDIRQLGADVLVVDGTARTLAAPSSPDDRVPPEDLVAAAAALVDGVDG
jgi:hypothetical protein